MRRIDRFDKYMEINGLNDNKVTVKTGLAIGTIGKSRKEGRDLSDKAIEKILNTYPEINRVWLLTGEGEMMKSQYLKSNTATSEHGKLIPFYDAEAAAGNRYEMDMLPSRPVGMIEIGSVLRDCESAIRVYGNSMVPNYPAGCVIGLKLHTDSFIEPGRVYVVETRDNRYLKRLYYSKDKKAFH